MFSAINVSTQINMSIADERCAGLDVHKRSVVACLLFLKNGQPHKERQIFSTMTSDVLRLRDWLKEHDCTCVAHGIRNERHF
jgi:transposase